MSQPLSNKLGTKRGIDSDRGPVNLGRKVQVNAEVSEEEPVERMLPVRDVIALVLLLVAIILIPVGVFMVAGLGAALIAVGALALISGVLVGLL